MNTVHASRVLRRVTACLAAFAAGTCLSGPVDAEPATAPNFAIQDVNGRPFQLSDLRGKVVIIDFWTTWCAPCRREIPGLIALQDKYGPKGLVIVGVSIGEDLSTVALFVRTQKINYPVIHGTPSIAAKYGNISSFPTTFILDRSGKIVANYEGFVSEKDVEKIIQPLL